MLRFILLPTAPKQQMMECFIRSYFYMLFIWHSNGRGLPKAEFVLETKKS